MPEAGSLAFLRGLRIATLAVAAAVTAGLSLPILLGSLDAYALPELQVAAFVALAGIIVVDAVLASGGRAWGNRRWPALAVLLVVAVGIRFLLPPGDPLPLGDWSYGEVGWVALLVLADAPLTVFLAVVVGHTLLGTAVVVATAPTPDAVPAFVLSSVAICTFQAAVGAAGAALRGVARSAVAAARQEEEVRTAQLVARSLHLDRLRHYGDVARTARPLLAGLAEGSADPDDPDFRRRCAVEAARMRRLFAESDDAADPLMHELRVCVEAAERRGVTVSLGGRGTWPALPREVRRALTDTPLAVLATARTAARVTVVGTPGMVVVSVTADTLPTEEPDEAPERDGAVTVRTVDDAGRLWVEARWTAGRPRWSSTTIPPSSRA